MAEPTNRPLYVGIDLGTTNSAAAVFDGDDLTVVRNGELVARVGRNPYCADVNLREAYIRRNALRGLRPMRAGKCDMKIVDQLDSEWDDKGFLGQLRTGTFVPKDAARFLSLLKNIHFIFPMMRWFRNEHSRSFGICRAFLHGSESGWQHAGRTSSPLIALLRTCITP